MSASKVDFLKASVQAQELQAIVDDQNELDAKLRRGEINIFKHHMLSETVQVRLDCLETAIK